MLGSYRLIENHERIAQHLGVAVSMLDKLLDKRSVLIADRAADPVFAKKACRTELIMVKPPVKRSSDGYCQCCGNSCYSADLMRFYSCCTCFFRFLIKAYGLGLMLKAALAHKLVKGNLVQKLIYFSHIIMPPFNSADLSRFFSLARVFSTFFGLSE